MNLLHLLVMHAREVFHEKVQIGFVTHQQYHYQQAEIEQQL
jgi:hypothetical protein